MTTHINWHPEGGLFVPNIERFAARVLPVHFPEMKAWGSFVKQLNNYGFEKRNRSTTEAWYSHWDNKFWTGYRALLPQVLRRPKVLPLQFTVQDPPLAPSNTPPAAIMVPQPSNQPDSAHRISELEKLLEVTCAKVSRMEDQLRKMDALVQNLSNQLSALSIGSGSADSQAHTGPPGGAVSNQYPANGACHTNDRQDGGGTSQGAYSQMRVGMPFGAMDTTPDHQPPAAPTQPSTNTSSAGPSHSLHHATSLPTAGVPFPQEILIESSWNVSPTFLSSLYSGQQQDAGPCAGPSAWVPIANADSLPPTPTTQPLARGGGYSSGSSSGRRHFGGTHPVPPPSPRQRWF